MFRAKFATTLIAVLAVGVAAIFGSYVFVERALALKLLFLVLAAPWLFIAVRTIRSGLVLSADGVHVRGLLRDRHAKWSEVTGFGFVRGSPLNSNVYIAVMLSSGSHLQTSGLTAGSKTSKYGTRIVAELEMLHQIWARSSQSADS